MPVLLGSHTLQTKFRHCNKKMDKHGYLGLEGRSLIDQLKLNKDQWEEGFKYSMQILARCSKTAIMGELKIAQDL